MLKSNRSTFGPGYNIRSFMKVSNVHGTSFQFRADSSPLPLAVAALGSMTAPTAPFKNSRHLFSGTTSPAWPTIDPPGDNFKPGRREKKTGCANGREAGMKLEFKDQPPNPSELCGNRSSTLSNPDPIPWSGVQHPGPALGMIFIKDHYAYAPFRCCFQFAGFSLAKPR